MEESDPLHSETRREAEVIKQVHESDPVYDQQHIVSNNTTEEPLDALADDSKWNNLTPDVSHEKGARSSFDEHAKRNSGGLGFWNNFESTSPMQNDRYLTPPPPSLLPQDSSSMMSVEGIETSNPFHDQSGAGSLLKQLHRSRSRSTTPLASAHVSQAGSNANGQPLIRAGDVARKVNNKRRRDDDFDPVSFKRRAVSPGMSVQSSPVVPQSPTSTSDKAWGRPPPKTPQARQNSDGNSSTPGGGVKRIGLQAQELEATELGIIRHCQVGDTRNHYFHTSLLIGYACPGKLITKLLRHKAHAL
ncbi:hypothetical protein LTR66_016437 [Elasticomyces elasticus]|nr:hypothetical protein LTR66_016437 [Elasticomyces elasticus]